ncbi:MAG: class I SAM-dependent methyltransferase, partial [Bacilli bacterium]|nr:class I SAM-dependent methyltransferase [Bacilli bacterium]
MTKISKRLKAIAEFVSKKDSLVDVGCDHGLLSIYLVENECVKRVIASDINQNALNSAIKNIKIRNMNIDTVLSDG